MNDCHRNEVFVAGGQPTHTYINRKAEHIEKNLVRAVEAPSQIVSLSGASKSGKTVLCRKVLEATPYVWVDGGNIRSAEGFWEYVSGEINAPFETSRSETGQDSLGGQIGVPNFITANGSKLRSHQKISTHRIDTLGHALRYMTDEGIALVIDDFHYIKEDVRREVSRNIKGAVFNGLKVVLLSISHRVFDVIKSEPELTGRFTSVTLPPWNIEDLKKIPYRGFRLMGRPCPDDLRELLANEAQENPFLMQKFCWEICFELGIERTDLSFTDLSIEPNTLQEIFSRLAKDSGLPIYRELVTGPQSRKVRKKRELKDGGAADIYEVLLQAIAATGPKPEISYDEIRNELSTLLSDKLPQKNEITSSLKHLTAISRKINSDSAIDWNEDERKVTVADPYLRFFLRWQVRNM